MDEISVNIAHARGYFNNECDKYNRNLSQRRNKVKDLIFKKLPALIENAKINIPDGHASCLINIPYELLVSKSETDILFKQLCDEFDKQCVSLSFKPTITNPQHVLAFSVTFTFKKVGSI